MSSGSPIIFLNEDADSYYEAYTDGIFVGSPGLSFENPNQWSRKRLGSKVKANSTAWEESLLLSEYVEGESDATVIYGGNARISKAFSPELLYKDSKTPDLSKIYTTGSFGSGSVCYPSNESGDFFDLVGNDRFYTILFSTNGYLTSSNNGQRVSNTEWQYAFPFEKKYQMLDTGVVYATFSFQGNIDDLDWKYNSGSILAVSRDIVNIAYVSGSAAGSQLGVKTYTFITQRSRPVPLGPFDDLIATNSELDRGFASKFVFGIKTRPVSTTTYAPGPSSGDSYIFASGAFIEGWRYGLLSGIQQNPYAVFLPDRYGQYFHMLYTPPLSALLPTTGSNIGGDSINGPLLNGVTFISGAALSGEQDMWLTASIYSGSNMSDAYAVNPKCSGIYDRYCRSGMPWFDDDQRLAQ